MISVFIGIGSNLGNRKKNLEGAIEKVKKIEKTRVDKVSSFIETKPQEAVGPNYLNGAIKIKTDLSPEELLYALSEIEIALGRRRDFKNCPRTIDLDILLYGRRKIKTGKLTVPHPRIMERKFVTMPLFEIEPNLKKFLAELY